MLRRIIVVLCLLVSVMIAGCAPTDEGGQGTDAPPAATPSPTRDDAAAGDDY
ncbi:MAG: hypothetical protein M3153_05620 [Chloroflexota bacterium]|nr:hypothetical protein [Chloroflexota bacterium]